MSHPPPPIKLTYAPQPRDRRPAAERAAAIFAFVGAVVVIGSGSVAWALLVRHR